MIDKIIQQQINSKWLDFFPSLAKWGNGKFYQIVGSLVNGIELIKNPREVTYRPYFVVYPLWTDDIKEVFKAPIAVREIENQKRLQFNIPYTLDNIYLLDALNCTRTQVGIPFGQHVAVQSIYRFSNSMLNDALVQIHPGKQAKYYLFMLLNALYVDDRQMLNVLLQKIDDQSSSWNDNKLFKAWYGSFVHWRQTIQDTVENREKFLSGIAENKQSPKLKKLKLFELHK